MNTCMCGCGTPVAQKFRVGHSRRRPVLDRLLEKVFVEASGCWIWQGATASNGYGRIGTGLGKATGQVHRVAYEQMVGPIPSGLHLDHLCRHRLCVNPDHLEPVTQTENNRRAARANRKSHCPKGHAMTPENTVPGRQRQCRICRNEQVRTRREAKRAKRQLLTEAGY